MRVTFLTHFPGRGGSNSMLNQLTTFLSARGHCVSTLAGADSKDPVLRDYTVVPESKNWHGRMEIYVNAIQQTTPDVVYSMSGKDELDVLRFLKTPRIRHVFSLEQHEHVDIRFWLQQMDGYLETITANTPDVLKQIRLAGVTRHAAVLAPYQFPSAAEPNKSSVGQETHVCFIGRLECFQKRAHWLPKVIEQCERAGAALRWHIYGDGPCEKYVRDKLAQQGNAGLVTFYGWADPLLLQKNLPGHDVFFLCSRWEGLPVAMVEAMLQNLACVVPAIPAGITYALEQGGGWTYDATSPAAAARALVNAVADKALLQQRKEEAGKIARQLFHGSKVEKELCALEESMQHLRFNGSAQKLAQARPLRAVRWPTVIKRKITALPRRLCKPC